MPSTPSPNTNALSLIAEERQKHLRRGWGPEGDDKLLYGELIDAAVAHALHGLSLHFASRGNDWTAKSLAQSAIEWWPFKQRQWNEAGGWFPPDTPLENYVKAAAFLAAEIDRILRVRNAQR